MARIEEKLVQGADSVRKERVVVSILDEDGRCADCTYFKFCQATRGAVATGTCADFTNLRRGMR